MIKLIFAIKRMKPWKKIFFLLLSILFIFSSLSLSWKVRNFYTVEIPARHGSMVEGIIGTPRFINPVLAESGADKDMVSIIYSGLLRPDNRGGLIKDLAEKYEISEDGLTYTFTLKPNIFWSDGKPITADDVAYTIEQIQNPSVKSPRRASWQGVTVEKTNGKTLKFTLEKAYAPFLDNAIIGIIPRHIWQEVSPEEMLFSEININPIGSGPYKINKIKKTSTGAVERYEMIPNKNFILGLSNIKKVVFKFYHSEKEVLEAYRKNEIENINTVTPSMFMNIKNDDTTKSFRLPKVFGVFFNQNNVKALIRKEVRQALDISVDREGVIEEVLKGHGVKLNGPFPMSVSSADKLKSNEFDLDKARKLLEDEGWKMNKVEKVLEKKIGKELTQLKFSIATLDASELKQTALLLKIMWEQIGAKVDVKIFEQGDLKQNIIRPRKYDALLFGETTGRDPDPFVFWHSSQRNDPGLNIALYANIKADNILEEARVDQDEKSRWQKYDEFQEEINKDIPSIFLFSPNFVYVVPKKLRGMDTTTNIVAPSDRFYSIYEWYKETDRVWKIFAK